MEKIEEEFEMPNIKKIRLEVFERENPEGVKILEQKIKSKILKTQEEVVKLVEQTIENYFKNRKVKKYETNYVG